MKVIVRGNPVKGSKSKGGITRSGEGGGISTETVIVKMAVTKLGRRKGTSDVTKMISDGFERF
jgi:hypothetical protein